MCVPDHVEPFTTLDAGSQRCTCSPPESLCPSVCAFSVPLQSVAMMTGSPNAAASANVAAVTPFPPDESQLFNGPL
jgi:hypothetical protein